MSKEKKVEDAELAEVSGGHLFGDDKLGEIGDGGGGGGSGENRPRPGLVDDMKGEDEKDDLG